jgi:hypothetical protein
LLRQGYWDVEKQQRSTYTSLILCTIPKGGVVLWLGGTNQTLIGRFQGQPSAVDFKQFYGSANRAKILQEVRAQMPPDVQQQIGAGTFGAQKWDEYLCRYPWKVEISQPLTLYKYSLHCLNAERVRAPLSRDLGPYLLQLLDPTPKAIPRKLYLYGQDEHGSRHQIRITSFDEAETMAAFQTLSQADPQRRITLFIEVSKDLKKAASRYAPTANSFHCPEPRCRFLTKIKRALAATQPNGGRSSSEAHNTTATQRSAAAGPVPR